MLLPVFYVASIGPVCGAASRWTHRNDSFDAIYWPIGWSIYGGPSCLMRPLAWYAERGMPAGHRWHLRARPTPEGQGSFVLIGKSPI